MKNELNCRAKNNVVKSFLSYEFRYFGKRDTYARYALPMCTLFTDFWQLLVIKLLNQFSGFQTR